MTSEVVLWLPHTYTLANIHTQQHTHTHIHTKNMVPKYFNTSTIVKINVYTETDHGKGQTIPTSNFLLP